MLVSAREAAQILALTGLGRERARRVLLAGFAGEGVRTRGALLYDEARVRALLEWQHVDPAALEDVAQGGLFVARVTDRGGLPERRWDLSPWARLEMRRIVEAQGHLPFVATVCGFVATGSDVTAVWPGRDGEGSSLELTEPGEWFHAFRNRRFVTGPGGTWLLWKPRPGRLQE